MIARIAARGHSFKGAGMYYLHDKEAQTTKRVAWTETRNLPMNDPEAATKFMAFTAINSNKIKQEAGIPLTGRKREKGVVYTFSLSWSPEEQPSRELMIQSADETLEVLGLMDHQSLIVAHNDTKHPHIHIICNLVSPTDGRMYDPDWGSKLKMSDWSLKHEFENGKVHCDQRVENHEKRKRGELVKYQEPLHDRKAEIQQLYKQSDNGKAFSAALEGNGYTLAKGNRRRFVLVDSEGRVHSLSRQLDKDQRKNHIDKFSDLNHQDLPIAQDVVANRQFFDRDKQEREQLQRIEDAAIDAEEKKIAEERHQKKQFRKSTKDVREIKYKQPPINDNKQEHLIRLDKEQAWDKVALQKRAELERKIEEIYGRTELVKTIESFERQLVRYNTTWGRKMGKYKELEKEIKAKKMTLENIDMRISEERAKLENELTITSPYKDKGQAGGQTRDHVIDLDREKKRRPDKSSKPPRNFDDTQFNLDR